MKGEKGREEEGIEKGVVFGEGFGDDVDVVLCCKLHLDFDLLLKDDSKFESIDK